MICTAFRMRFIGSFTACPVRLSLTAGQRRYWRKSGRRQQLRHRLRHSVGAAPGFPKGGYSRVPAQYRSVCHISEQYRTLGRLREEGALISGSGNVVHNLTRVDWRNAGGYQWAEEFDRYICDRILNHDYDSVIHFDRTGESAGRSVDHFVLLLSHWDSELSMV